MSWEIALLMKLSNDVEKYEIEVQNGSKLLIVSYSVQRGVRSCPEAHHIDAAQQWNVMTLVLIDVRS